ncbi:hypothetical protein D1007_61881 [Hordeum vulgare]|nr:hypothetical protein D1007_61881 [Hordeum vulgare]
MSAPKKTKFVDIGDALLSNDDLECLMRDDMFLHDGVINAYIYCMLAHDHLRERMGEKVHIISTFVSGQMKEDGEKDICPLKYRHIVQNVNTYLQQDMLFIPVNIPRYHWYLAVVNAKKHKIQVLDSLGAKEKRSELATTLLGLEKRLKLGEQSSNFNRDHKWLDLNVTKWKVVEHFQEATQTDGTSCGLFMLNYMEYWTKDALSDEFTQEDMKHFRQKLVVILLDSELNKLKGCPLYNQYDDEVVLPNCDVEILDNPLDRIKHKRPTPIPIMPTDQRTLLAGLCNCIMLIDDAQSLEREWVRTSIPDPMSLTLKKIQGILNTEQSMDNDCFNIAVRILACDEGVLFTDPAIHYMDMRFSSIMLESTRGQKFCEKETIQTLGSLFDGWPGMDINISSCNMAFPKRSPLVDDFSRAMLSITEGDTIIQIERKWIGDQNTCQNDGPTISSKVQNFSGLFLLTGVASTSALLIALVMFLYKRYKKKNNTGQIKTTADSNPSHDMQLTVPDVSDSYACQQEIEISRELTSPCSEVQSTPDFTPHGTPGNGL